VPAPNFDVIVSLAKRRGFVFPSSEIYGGMAGFWDWGPLGVELKNNVKAAWWRHTVQLRDDIVGIEASVIMSPRVWEASGHVAGFSDPMVDCRNCKLRFRTDDLKGDSAEIACPNCGQRGTLTEPRQFNLMFATHVGPVADSASVAYLRPETAQAMFVQFDNVATTTRRKLPFGIAQMGRSFRNEITPGNFIFRLREFEQMEMEFFVPPRDEDEWFAYWVDSRHRWWTDVMGIDGGRMRLRPHEQDELSHYSKQTTDIEYEFPIGWSELEGVANRGTYDLTQHSEASGTKLEWVDAGTGERFVPHVIEPALGVNRSMLTFLIDAYDEEVVGERARTVLRLHPQLAPVTAAVLPLIAKEAAMVEKARALFEELRRHFSVEYDDNGAIGRRYRRQDEIGTPYGLTIDEQTLEDETVTLRDRDSLEQERIPIGGVRARVADLLTSDWRSPKTA
jgi:glycyl-tRNA synthetase